MISWFAVATNLPDRKVVRRCAAALSISEDTAIARLVCFWSAAVMADSGGDISDVPDATLEAWARWRGKRGKFAAWVRRDHATDGHINDWDELQGHLDAKRKADRERKRLERERKQAEKSHGRSRGQSTDGHADSPEDVTRTVLPHTTQQDTTRTPERASRKSVVLSSAARSENGAPPVARATEPPRPPTAPVQLPRELRTFLATHHGAEPQDAKTRIREQARAVLNGGIEWKHGVVRATAERIREKIRECEAGGVKGNGWALLLTKLADVSDDSPTERAASTERHTSWRDERDHASAAQVYRVTHPDEAQAIEERVLAEFTPKERAGPFFEAVCKERVVEELYRAARTLAGSSTP
jgi:hypothetical protein